MPINTDLNIAPYFDDFDLEKQFYKILFKPAYAVQARELTQLQTILQNQIEQFGDNIYQEGSIIKGCTFTDLSGLQYVKLVDKTGFDVESYISGPSTDIISGVETDIDIVYEIEGVQSGLKASIISAARGFETRPPNLNTFFINYLNTNETSSFKVFIPGENIKVNRYKYNGSTLYSTELNIANINVTLQSNPTGKSFGIQASQGVIFQKGHFLFADDQTLIVSKYTDQPDDISVGYEVTESLVTSLQDNTLYDNANGSTNENAPGADRLKLTPVLVAKSTAVADVDANFFTLIRYQNGSAVQLRDVTQFHSIAEEMAKRTYEESGNYIVDRFKTDFDRRGADLTALVGKGSAYVKGYRVENSGKVDFVIDQVENTSIHNNQATTVDYGSYVDVVSITGTIGLEYDQVSLRSAAAPSVEIGTAYVKNITPTRLYLFGVKMNSGQSFSSVTKVVGTAGEITIAANSTVKEVQKAPFIFNTGTSYLKSATDLVVPQRVVTDAVVTGGNTITLTGNGWDFGLDQSDIVVVDASYTLIPVTSYSTSGSNSILTINLGAAADPTATVYFNNRLANAVSPYSKVVRTTFVKVNFTAATSKYSLGFPDVYKVLDIYDTSGTRFTDSFKLNPNQNDHFYDISYIEYIPGRPKPANGVLTIKLSTFEINSSTGKYFFSIDSYPVDDTSTTLPDDKIRSSDISVYKSTNGVIYNLREAFDFRPYADKDSAVSYTSTASTAGTVTTAVGAYTNQFSRTDYVIPPLNSNVIADLEFYLARTDVIIMDSYGRLSLVKGEESEIPVAPKVSPDVLVVSEINIPGYPVLTPKEAADQNKIQCAVVVTPKGTKNYTMRDIEKIDKRLKNLEYYVSLNQLEQQTENMLILDENGLTRFKNGYVVDAFKNAQVANLDDPNYKAAIHFNRGILTPALNTFPLDLKYKTSSGATIFPNTNSPELATLSRNAHVKLLGQPYATNYRNCASNFWKYNGQVQISPDHDMLPSVTENPRPINIDIASAFQELNELFPMTDTVWQGNVRDDLENQETTFGRTRGFFGFFRRRTTTVTTPLVEDGTIRNLVVNGGNTDVGDFVSNVNFQPYMRSRDINVYVTGLRPNTRHYFFFDRIDVNQHVWNGTAVNHPRDMLKSGVAGASVATDSNGVLRAVFTIPEGTFFVGDRILSISDVSTYGDIESAGTSSAEITYHAFNVNVEMNTLSTRMPEFTVDTEATTRNVGTRVQTTRSDPLAQTFFIKEGMGRGSNSVFVSKVDLYFKRKSDINGVTIMLREVLNGYPSSEILPFSKIHLTPDQVNVSDDASAVTTVDFTAPVRLDVEKEYAIVIMPDASDPGYLHFTSKVGGLDLTPGETQGQAVVQDWGDGVLFTSTNNRAWKSYQDEDIKFTLYRHDFNASVGTVTFTNDDHEFFTLGDWTGRFQQEEIVYKENAAGYTVSVVQNTSVVTTSGNDFAADYSAGDYIKIVYNTNVDIFKIASVDSSTQMTLTKPCTFTANAATGTSITVGIVSHYNKFNRSEMHLKKSSATTTKKFAAGDTITGFTSGVTGTIGSVDNINLSYIQPIVMKSNDSVTTTSMNGLFNSAVDPIDNYTLPMKFGDNNTFTAKGVTVYSKSNNLFAPKPFDINIEMANRSNPTSTPVVDIELSSAIGYQYKVTNDVDTTSKYISKTVELSADLDAEDMEVYLTGYRPNGTDIKVYIKPQHAQDSTTFDNINWIEMELTQGVNTYSSSVSLDDYREYKYVVPESAKNGSGIIQYTSSAGTFVGYRKFAIKIELLSSNIHNVPFVKDYRGIALT